MSTVSQSTDRPPLSMPKAAITVLIYLYLLLGSVPAISLMLLGPILRSPTDLLDAHFILYVAVVGGWLLALLFIVRSGRVVGLRLFRGTAWLLTALVALGLVGAVLLSIGQLGNGTRTVRLTGQFGVIGLAICSAFLWRLLRGLTQVRWLDPKSTPNEWEPPARRKDVFLKTMTKQRSDD